MPNYIYVCEDCDSQFEISRPMDKIVGFKAECPSCEKNNTYRDFSGIIVHMPSTLGMLAEKNARGMSEDNKEHLNSKFNEYRKKEFAGKLPVGAKTYKKDSEGKRIPRE